MLNRFILLTALYIFFMSKVIYPQDSYLTIEPYIFSNSVNFVDLSNASKGNISSKTSYAINLGWHTLLTKELEFGTFFEIKKFNYASIIESSNGAPRNFINHKFVNYQLGTSLSYLVTDDLLFELKIKYGDEDYFRVPSSTSVTFDQSDAFIYSFGTFYVFFTTTNTKFGFGLIPTIISAKKIDGLYSADDSYGSECQFYIKHKMIKTKLSYFYLVKDTELFEQKHTVLNLKVELSWYY